MNPWLWLAAGAAVGAAVALGALPAWRALQHLGKREPSMPVMVLGGLGVFAAVAVILHLAIDARRGHPAPDTAAVASDAGSPVSQNGANTEPRSAGEWLALAAERRHNRDYVGARDAYAQVIQLNAMTADSWADYADALASLPGGSLGGDAEHAIQRALELDPTHPKALWLQASHAYEQHRYAAAVELWKRLRATLRSDSPDAAIVDANIAESSQLAGTPKG